MKRKDGFVLREICGCKVILCEGFKTVDFGKLISLNETAAWVWDAMGRYGNSSIDELASAMCEEYDVSYEKAQKDIETLTNYWLETGLVEL